MSRPSTHQTHSSAYFSTSDFSTRPGTHNSRPETAFTSSSIARSTPGTRNLWATQHGSRHPSARSSDANKLPSRLHSAQAGESPPATKLTVLTLLRYSWADRADENGKHVWKHTSAGAEIHAVLDTVTTRDATLAASAGGFSVGTIAGAMKRRTVFKVVRGIEVLEHIYLDRLQYLASLDAQRYGNSKVTDSRRVLMIVARRPLLAIKYMTEKLETRRFQINFRPAEGFDTICKTFEEFGLHVVPSGSQSMELSTQPSMAASGYSVPPPINQSAARIGDDTVACSRPPSQYHLRPADFSQTDESTSQLQTQYPSFDLRRDNAYVPTAINRHVSQPVHYRGTRPEMSNPPHHSDLGPQSQISQPIVYQRLTEEPSHSAVEPRFAYPINEAQHQMHTTMAPPRGKTIPHQSSYRTPYEAMPSLEKLDRPLSVDASVRDRALNIQEISRAEAPYFPYNLSPPEPTSVSQATASSNQQQLPFQHHSLAWCENNEETAASGIHVDAYDRPLTAPVRLPATEEIMPPKRMLPFSSSQKDQSLEKAVVSSEPITKTVETVQKLPRSHKRPATAAGVTSASQKAPKKAATAKSKEAARKKPSINNRGTSETAKLTVRTGQDPELSTTKESGKAKAKSRPKSAVKRPTEPTITETANQTPGDSDQKSEGSTSSERAGAVQDQQKETEAPMIIQSQQLNSIDTKKTAAKSQKKPQPRRPKTSGKPDSTSSAKRTIEQVADEESGNSMSGIPKCGDCMKQLSGPIDGIEYPGSVPKPPKAQKEFPKESKTKVSDESKTKDKASGSTENFGSIRTEDESSVDLDSTGAARIFSDAEVGTSAEQADESQVDQSKPCAIETDSRGGIGTEEDSSRTSTKDVAQAASTKSKRGITGASTSQTSPPELSNSIKVMRGAVSLITDDDRANQKPRPRSRAALASTTKPKAATKPESVQKDKVDDGSEQKKSNEISKGNSSSPVITAASTRSRRFTKSPSTAASPIQPRCEGKSAVNAKDQTQLQSTSQTPLESQAQVEAGIPLQRQATAGQEARLESSIKDSSAFSSKPQHSTYADNTTQACIISFVCPVPSSESRPPVTALDNGRVSDKGEVDSTATTHVSEELCPAEGEAVDTDATNLIASKNESIRLQSQSQMDVDVIEDLELLSPDIDLLLSREIVRPNGPVDAVGNIDPLSSEEIRRLRKLIEAIDTVDSFTQCLLVRNDEGIRQQRTRDIRGEATLNQQRDTSGTTRRVERGDAVQHDMFRTSENRHLSNSDTVGNQHHHWQSNRDAMQAGTCISSAGNTERFPRASDRNIVRPPQPPLSLPSHHFNFLAQQQQQPPAPTSRLPIIPESPGQSGILTNPRLHGIPDNPGHPGRSGNPGHLGHPGNPGNPASTDSLTKNLQTMASMQNILRSLLLDEGFARLCECVEAVLRR